MDLQQQSAGRIFVIQLNTNFHPRMLRHAVSRGVNSYRRPTLLGFLALWNLFACSLLAFGCSAESSVRARAPSSTSVDVCSGAEQCLRQCSAGEGDACAQLGDMFAGGTHGAPRDLERARSLWTLACDGGDAKGCAATASELAAHHEYSGALLFASKACVAGEPRGCTELGAYAFAGTGTRRSTARAQVLWQQACEQGEERACAYLGMVDLGREGANRARKRLQGACDDTHHAGCAGLGLLLERGLGGPRDFRGALGAYLSGCHAGESSACVFAGVLIEENSDAPAHKRRALELYELGCNAPTSQLCWVDDADPNGPFRGHFVGEGLQRRSCGGGQTRALACYNAALSYERGNSGLVDGHLAQKRLDASCAQGFELACRPAHAYEVH